MLIPFSAWGIYAGITVENTPKLLTCNTSESLGGNQNHGNALVRRVFLCSLSNLLAPSGIIQVIQNVQLEAYLNSWGTKVDV